MSSKKNVFVVRHGNDWATKVAGSQCVSKVYDTQKEAIENRSELTIQNREGKFREKNSYGNDPKNVRG